MDDGNRKNLKDLLADYLPLPAETEPHLKAALEGVLRNPGSMVRPEIVSKMFAAYGLPSEHATELGIALEYFHTSSLLFDDLPCMDDAVERRGAPCAHVQYGEAEAILAALALINKAYGLTWRAIAGCGSTHQITALNYVEQYLGVGGLLNGQSMDLNYGSLRQNPQDHQTTERIAMGKTVSLIRLTLVLPGILGGASAQELQLLERVAICWGLSYQIVDDLKDVLHTPAESGKTVSRDASLGRPNIVLVVGIENAVKRLSRLIHIGDWMLRRIVDLRPDVAFLQDLRRQLNQEADEIMSSACEPSVRGAA
jgi:geranylgeranyl diphosphate synthase type II